MLSEFGGPWLACAFALYCSAALLMAHTSLYQHTIMDKLQKELPLDDAIHSISPLWLSDASLATCYIPSWCRQPDAIVTVAPLLVLGLAYRGATLARRTIYGAALEFAALVRLPEAFLEFGALGLYKMILCIATRLPPPVQSHGNIRTVCGFPTATWIDYGISGHSGLFILLWLHLRTPCAFVLAFAQSVLSVVSRDHYTLDVMHAWVFCFAVHGVFSSCDDRSRDSGIANGRSGLAASSHKHES